MYQCRNSAYVPPLQRYQALRGPHGMGSMTGSELTMMDGGEGREELLNDDPVYAQ